MDAQIPNIFVFVLRRREGVKPERFSCMEGNGQQRLDFQFYTIGIYFFIIIFLSKTKIIKKGNKIR